eukprot:c21050_g1_i1.p1 GENE.c21050_g1_i1~~c21050_g1_i1.p1  ORF type:complete len:110 (-),score=15.18 c21050_g1_i1:59-388(-)
MSQLLYSPMTPTKPSNGAEESSPVRAVGTLVNLSSAAAALLQQQLRHSPVTPNHLAVLHIVLGNGSVAGNVREQLEDAEDAAGLDPQIRSIWPVQDFLANVPAADEEGT